MTVVVVCLLIGAAFARGADSSLVHARQAQVKLGPEIWSEVIRIDNDAPGNRYPRTLHGLVFELADILWFYTDCEGTQSLSLHRSSATEEKADLAPLLRAIEPGFTRWGIVPDDRAAPVIARGGELPNGCFIESVAALRMRREQGDPARNAQLLSYYLDTQAGGRGHTILTFVTGCVIEVIDPLQPERPRRFPASLAADALKLARAVAGERIAKARWVPIDRPAGRDGLFASGGFAGAGIFGDAMAW